MPILRGAAARSSIADQCSQLDALQRLTGLMLNNLLLKDILVRA